MQDVQYLFIAVLAVIAVTVVLVVLADTPAAPLAIGIVVIAFLYVLLHPSRGTGIAAPFDAFTKFLQKGLGS